MRINAYLASCGVASRRKADAIIESGRVLINSKKAQLSDRVATGDRVELDGEVIEPSAKKYFLIYKPVGYVSTVSDPHAKKKVIDLIDCQGLFPVGRLDQDSEGLMILTNDGEFAQKLIHPSYAHEKEYLVRVKLPSKNKSEALEDALKFFKCGVRLDNLKTRPAKIKLLSCEGEEATFQVILEQGIKRQIRRTFEKAGLKVAKLIRLRIGDYHLGDLEPGYFTEFRP